MYVCQTFDEASQAYLECVPYDNYSFLSELAITKEQMVVIGHDVGVILSIILGFVMLFKALKSM
ncbi:hypothetical protein ACT3TH_10380 [Psychrobacter sp. AOP22-C1-C5]|uniref:hypothetical protein n=1 Tax=Psychrobacter sp. AOP22-C1-C5 TaxID=3457716 RepID=UPI0040360E0B